MNPTDDLPAVDALSYEQARDELVEVVHRLEAGATTLEESLALWERGEALADRCQSWLDGARERLDAVRAANRPGETTATANRPGETAAPGSPPGDRAAAARAEPREAALEDAAAALPSPTDEEESTR